MSIQAYLMSLTTGWKLTITACANIKLPLLLNIDVSILTTWYISREGHLQ
ncbi:conserved hypothetical protein [Histoplasma capsulatum H143]|uniref:Uncharacterized protein n=1 Tax=Ajellomyces capsulatus (strain H143) TaxID=544712 RepID=C6H8C2_AJECH|nr:conserved hypothetical protein [Histoplasma capsulatum H143]